MCVKRTVKESLWHYKVSTYEPVCTRHLNGCASLTEKDKKIKALWLKPSSCKTFSISFNLRTELHYITDNRYLCYEYSKQNETNESFEKVSDVSGNLNNVWIRNCLAQLYSQHSHDKVLKLNLINSEFCLEEILLLRHCY